MVTFFFFSFFSLNTHVFEQKLPAQTGSPAAPWGKPQQRCARAMPWRRARAAWKLLGDEREEGSVGGAFPEASLGRKLGAETVDRVNTEAARGGVFFPQVADKEQ